tara:strand:+ start:243 stop:941 length:699 start_codon:yes stop_codon:yes gene_type:complete
LINLFKTLLGVLSIVLLLFLFSKLEMEYNKINIKDVQVLTEDYYSVGFDKEILNDITKDILSIDTNRINLHDVEEYLNKKNKVESAEVYFTIDKKLNINVKERMPVLKVNNLKGDVFFLDTNFVKIKKSIYKDLDCLIANGFIDDENLFFLYDLAREIYFDSFLKNFISQIYVNEDNTVELIPALFNHKIVINNISQLKKIKIFYNKINNDVDINKYSELKFMFNKQVVAVE